MEQESLIYSLYQIGAIQFGEFKLKSGQTSSIYINLRKIISYPDILRVIANAMWKKTRGCHFDLVCGVPYTALPIATCISLEHNISMIMRRKEKKDYGTKQLIEGEFQAGQRCLIIEDVVTTGGSIIETANDLEQAGLEVKDVVALIDRQQGGGETLSQKFQFHAILSLSDILQSLLGSTLLNKTERQILEDFLRTRAI
ncbi:orotate phosphoribosyltransferase [Aquicella lusitana]|uniref:Orotate phosphoribosyltransferase n=1 Tax=Aquicella lusitana TaxID=254246 RepID=A0A370GDK6_9COXI|nr:orotate phosphoribosyltransferase [Aquicella lusitana]RDI41310.1 orotate phosphoribosyltransferase [Aquicella lusitana]VVC72323.1 Orotate phosphoribosyltransferase [Aquicella lusitana]